MQDIAVSDDGAVLTIAVRETNQCNIYRGSVGGDWTRILSEDMAAANAILVRTAPGMPESIIVGWVGTKTIRYSHDSGTTWKRGESDVNIEDIAMKSDQVIFVMDNTGQVSTSKDGGATFAKLVKSNVSGDQIVVEPVSGDAIIIGGSGGFGRLSISSDDGASFSRTPANLGITDAGTPFFVAPHTDYATNNIVFAAQGANIMRWEVGGTMEDWRDCTTSGTYPIAGTEVITGLGMSAGSLYAMWNDPGVNSGFARTADETGRTPTWADNAVGAAVDFDLTPSALKLTSGSVRVWALDTAPAGKAVADGLYSFTDIVEAAVAPTLSGPDDGFQVSVDVELDKINPVRFSWDEVHELARYDLRMGTDATATDNRLTFDAATNEWITISDGAGGVANNQYPFIVGETYYYKVRVRVPVVGPWSDVRSFTVEEPERVAPAVLLTPVNGAMGASRNPAFSWQPIPGVTQYSFILAGNSLLANPIVEATKLKVPAYRVVEDLEYGKTYFWRVTPTAPAGEASPVFNFTVMDEPVVEAPPVVEPESFICPQCGLEFFDQQDLAKHWAEFHAPIPPAPPAPPPPPPTTPSWVWIVVGIGAALVIATLVLIVTTRRPPAP
jgi:hypothetical protein